MVLVGTTMRWGPQMPLFAARYASSEMVCSVLPRPISSARIPLRPCSYSDTSHSKPFSWYGRSV